MVRPAPLSGSLDSSPLALALQFDRRSDQGRGREDRLDLVLEVHREIRQVEHEAIAEELLLDTDVPAFRLLRLQVGVALERTGIEAEQLEEVRVGDARRIAAVEARPRLRKDIGGRRPPGGDRKSTRLNSSH